MHCLLWMYKDMRALRWKLTKSQEGCRHTHPSLHERRRQQQCRCDGAAGSQRGLAALLPVRAPAAGCRSQTKAYERFAATARFSIETILDQDLSAYFSATNGQSDDGPPGVSVRGNEAIIPQGIFTPRTAGLRYIFPLRLVGGWLAVPLILTAKDRVSGQKQ